MRHGNPRSRTRQHSETFEDLLTQEGGREFEALVSNTNTRSGPGSSIFTWPPPSYLRKYPASSLSRPFCIPLAYFVGWMRNTHHFSCQLFLSEQQPTLTEFSLWATYLISIMTLLKPSQSFLWYYHPCFTEKKMETRVSPLVSDEGESHTQV